MSQIHLGDVALDVVLKDIKNVHLSVHPPTGRVRISAPTRMSMDTIRVFAISKLDWIKKQQTKLREQERETPREYVERESHYVWGKRYLLNVIEAAVAPSVELTPRRVALRVRPGAGRQKRHAVFEEWYRGRLREAVLPVIDAWEPIIGVKVSRLFVQRMKTRWGSCNPRSGAIRLNTELAKKPPECLEYLVVHELAHLLEPTHNANFIVLMDRLMPSWQLVRQQLNRLPVSHAEWEY